MVIIMSEMEHCAEHDEHFEAFSDFSGRFPLAMAYVRIHKLDQMFPPELALKRGTLFPELDKPFCGITVMECKK